MAGTFTTDLKILNSAEVDNYLELGTFKFGTTINDDYKIESGNAILFGATTPNTCVVMASVGCTAVAINAGGTGYTAGDVLTVSGGTSTETTQLLVLTVSSGAVATVEVSRPGTYSVNPSNPVSVTGGTGSSATFNLTYGNKDLTSGGVHIFTWVKIFAWPATDTKAKGGLRVAISADATPTLVWGVYTYSVAAGGTGYTNGNTLTMSGTGTGATFTATVSGGIVTGLTLLTRGSYTAAPASPAATTGGSGTGCTITNTTLQAPTNSAQWFLGGNNTETVSGWINYAVNPNGTPDFLVGTCSINSIDRIGVAELAAAATTNKAGTVCLDVIRTGTGSIINDGTGQSPVTMADYAAYDIANARAWGIAVQQSGIYFMSGKLTTGTTTQTAVTVFADSTNLSLVYQDFPVASGFYEIKVQGASSYKTTFQLGSYTPSSGLTSGGATIKGSGNISGSVRTDGVQGLAHSIWKLTASDSNQVTKLYGCTFSEMLSAALTYNAVSVDLSTVTNGTTTLTTSGSFNTSGIVVGMLITGTGIPASTYVSSIGSATSLTMSKSATDSTTNTRTFAHNNEIRDCTFTNSGTITPSGCVMDSCTFQNLKTTAPISATYAVDAATTVPTITNCKFVNCATALRWPIDTFNPNGKLDGTSFISGGTGHAIEFTGSATSRTLTNITFTGYAATDGSTGNEAIYVNTSAGSMTLTISGGTTPSIRAAAGVTVTVVANTVTTLVNVKDHSGNNLEDARVFLKASDGTGNLPYNASVTLITRSGTTATVTHASAHGLNTDEYVKISGITDKTADNAGAHQITKTGANTYTYTTTDSGSESYTGIKTATGVTIYGLTDSNGNISSSRTYGLDQPLTGYVRKSTSGATKYKSFQIAGTVDTSNGLTINVRMILDE